MKTLFLSLLLFPAIATATICDSFLGDKNDPYYYADSMFDALKILNETVKNVSKGATNDTILNMTTSFPKMKCVIESLEPFTSSKNEYISSSSKGIAAGVEHLIKSQKDQIELMKKIESGEIKGKAKISESLGETVNQVGEAWSTISLAAMGSTYSLVDEIGLKKNEGVKAIVLTEKQKKDLINKIKRDFDTKKAATKLDGVAVVYLKFLNDKWETKK